MFTPNLEILPPSQRTLWDELAQMQGAERGLARLEAARARLTPEVVAKIIVSLNMSPPKLEDLQSLHTLVVALEKEVEDAQTDP